MAFNSQEGGVSIKSSKRISLVFFQNHSDQTPAQALLPICMRPGLDWPCNMGVAALRSLSVKTTLIRYQHKYAYLIGAQCEKYICCRAFVAEIRGQITTKQGRVSQKYFSVSKSGVKYNFLGASTFFGSPCALLWIYKNSNPI